MMSTGNRGGIIPYFFSSVLAVIYQLMVDPIAESWKAWFFSKDKVLGIWLINFPIENTIFYFLCSFAVASAVLSFITHQKRHGKEFK